MVFHPKHIYPILPKKFIPPKKFTTTTTICPENGCPTCTWPQPLRRGMPTAHPAPHVGCSPFATDGARPRFQQAPERRKWLQNLDLKMLRGWVRMGQTLPQNRSRLIAYASNPADVSRVFYWPNKKVQSGGVFLGTIILLLEDISPKHFIGISTIYPNISHSRVRRRP